MLALAMGLLVSAQVSAGHAHAVGGPTSTTSRSPTSSFWDTLPVGIHGGLRHRPKSDIASLAKFRVVVVDPVEGPVCAAPCHACCNASAAACAVENNLVRTLTAVKAIDNSTITMVYTNTILMMPYFLVSTKFFANASALTLRDRTGQPMVFAGDGGTGEFCSRFPSYDWVQPQARAAVLADFARMRVSGAVDGVYLDKSGTWPGFGDNGNRPVPQGSNTLCQHDCYTMTPSQTAAYTQGRLELFRAFDDACGTAGICSIDARTAQPPVTAMLQGYLPKSIHIFRAAAKKSYNNATISFVRGLENRTQRLLWYGTCETETEVAFFLVMAWEGCFCMTFSNDDTAATLWAGGWHYATQLGRPKGPAVLVKDNTWVRGFSGGTQARYDLRTSTGKVFWASSPNKGRSATAQATAILQKTIASHRNTIA